MSWMQSNTWVFFIPIMIIMKIEYTIPGKSSLLEFALFIKFITSHKRRQIGLIFIWLFFTIFRRTIRSRSGSHKLRNTLYIVSYFKKTVLLPPSFSLLPPVSPSREFISPTYFVVEIFCSIVRVFIRIFYCLFVYSFLRSLEHRDQLFVYLLYPGFCL